MDENNTNQASLKESAAYGKLLNDLRKQYNLKLKNYEKYVKESDLCILNITFHKKHIRRIKKFYGMINELDAINNEWKTRHSCVKESQDIILHINKQIDRIEQNIKHVHEKMDTIESSDSLDRALGKKLTFLNVKLKSHITKLEYQDLAIKGITFIVNSISERIYKLYFKYYRSISICSPYIETLIKNIFNLKKHKNQLKNYRDDINKARVNYNKILNGVLPDVNQPKMDQYENINDNQRIFSSAAANIDIDPVLPEFLRQRILDSDDHVSKVLTDEDPLLKLFEENCSLNRLDFIMNSINKKSHFLQSTKYRLQKREIICALLFFSSEVVESPYGFRLHTSKDSENSSLIDLF